MRGAAGNLAQTQAPGCELQAAPPASPVVSSVPGGGLGGEALGGKAGARLLPLYLVVEVELSAGEVYPAHHAAFAARGDAERFRISKGPHASTFLLPIFDVNEAAS